MFLTDKQGSHQGRARDGQLAKSYAGSEVVGEAEGVDVTVVRDALSRSGFTRSASSRSPCQPQIVDRARGRPSRPPRPRPGYAAHMTTPFAPRWSGPAPDAWPRIPTVWLWASTAVGFSSWKLSRRNGGSKVAAPGGRTATPAGLHDKHVHLANARWRTGYWRWKPPWEKPWNRSRIWRSY